MNDYKKLAKEQHRLLMKIMHRGSNDKTCNDDLRAYAKRVLQEKIFLKLG